MATADKLGEPNIIVVEVNKLTEKREIVVSDNLMKTTLKNIMENRKVAILFTDNQTCWWRIKGDAKYDKRGKWFNFVKKLKTNIGYKTKGVLIIKVKQIDDLNKGKTLLKF